MQKGSVHFSLRDISMLNNAQRHAKTSVECRVVRTFQGPGLAKPPRLALVYVLVHVCVQARVCVCARIAKLNKGEGQWLAGPLGSKSPFI